MAELTLQKKWELERKNNFGYCNIDKYHNKGYKGKGINFLNLEIGDHGTKVCKVYSEVAPEAKVFQGTLTGTTDGSRLTKFDITVNGVCQDFETFVVENNIKIMNSSKAGGVKVIQNFVKEFILDKHGVILTNSAGNDGDTVTGSFADVGIVVGAVNFNDGNPTLTYYSGKGIEVDFVAFAHLFVGTSFSAPFLAGKITLLLDKYGDFTQGECIEILKSISVDLGNAGLDTSYGYGIPVLPLEDEIKFIRGADEVDFKDIEETRWSKEAIDQCVAEGLFEGFEDGTFRPTAFVTREQMAVILQRILNR